MMLPLLAVSAFASLGAAQTYTSCNPTNSKSARGSKPHWTNKSSNV